MRGVIIESNDPKAKPFEIPQCPLHKKDMRVSGEDENMIMFICTEDQCMEMVDILKIYVDREDPILKNLWGWKDLL